MEILEMTYQLWVYDLLVNNIVLGAILFILNIEYVYQYYILYSHILDFSNYEHCIKQNNIS